jgi:hypothetical protein
MVSTGMQGGCTCENCPSLRTGTGNVEMAAVIAPRPLGLTAANDWTKTMPTDGFPQLQALYDLYGAKDKVALFPAIHFGHNFNHVARTSMYGWMNRHFQLGFPEPVLERDFEWKGREDLSVWDASHPQPESGEEFERKLLKEFRDNVEQQITALLSSRKHDEYRTTVRTGWKVTLGMTTSPIAEAQGNARGERQWQLSSASDGQWQIVRSDDRATSVEIIATDATGARRRYAVALLGEAWNEKGELVALEQQPLVKNPRLAAAYTYGYNIPMFARRARQLAATVEWLHTQAPDSTLTLEGAGANAALAAAGLFDLAVKLEPQGGSPSGTWLNRVKLQLAPGGFRFADAESIRDPNFLPCSARYLDVPGLVSCLGQKITISGDRAGEFARFAGVVEGQGGNLTITGKR